MNTPTKLKGCCFEYFGNGYEDIKLQEEMIRDRLTMEFVNQIKLNECLFKNKTVIDVDSGLGLLSMIFASAGAKKVIGIESSSLSEKARKIISKNNLDDKISIISGDVPQINSLPDGIDKVDIIISQWNGFLFYDQTLLNNFLEVRDRWLKPEGIVFPGAINLNIIAIEYEVKKEEILDILDVEGFDMSPLKNFEFSILRIEEIFPQQVITNSAKLRKINFKKAKKEKNSFTEVFELTALKSEWINAFVLYFDIELLNLHKNVIISTSPFHSWSRWNQIVLCFENEIFVNRDEKIKGKISFVQENAGLFSITLEVDFIGDFCEAQFYNVYKF